MSETTYSLDRDLTEASALAEGLEEYVRGERLYGSVGGGIFSSDPNMPSLTIGAVLLRLHRLQAQEARLSPEQKAILTRAEAKHERVRREWSLHYEQKLKNEADARLRSLSVYLADCDVDPAGCAGAYLPEALRRTILQIIGAAASRYRLPLGDFDQALRQQDARLRRLTAPSAFIWSPELQPVYPQEVYWWLYARPRATGDDS